jgi:hypothetical protein
MTLNRRKSCTYVYLQRHHRRYEASSYKLCCSADSTRQSSPRSGSTTFATNLSTRHLWRASSAMCIQITLLGLSLFEPLSSIAPLRLVRHVQS